MGHREQGQEKAARRPCERPLVGPVARPELPVAIEKPMATASSAKTADLVVVLRAIDPAALQGVRKKDGQVAVVDVLRLVTGQSQDACRKVWHRLLETHPELKAICLELLFKEKGRDYYDGCPAACLNHQTDSV